MSELLVYKASAGSGKTFTLAVEYIKLLIFNPRAYRQILAVTFTNKATAEMKERILSQLYGIQIGDKDSEAYLNRIKEETGKTEQEIREAAGIALSYMLHDYSRFRVETIDSFFQSVMRNLARELELSPNLNIELNNTEVLSDAVDSMIEKLGPTSPVLAWLLDYINERIADDKRWNVSDEVKSFGRNIFDEGYIEKGEGLRQRLRNPNTIKEYRKQLKALETEILEQMKGFYDQFEGELDGHALTADDLKNGSRGIGSYFRKLNNGVLSNDIRNATVEKCCDLYGAEYVESAKDICKDNKKHTYEWTATGTQFQIPYVFKTLFSKESIEFEDMCETKSVTSALYLDMNEDLPDVSEYERQFAKLLKDISDISKLEDPMTEECQEFEKLEKIIADGHNYNFIGKVGQFCPIKPGCGGGILLRETENKKTGEKGYAAATGSKGFRWLESEMVKQLDKQGDIDRSYYHNMVDEAVKSLSSYGDFERFTADEPYVSDNID